MTQKRRRAGAPKTRLATTALVLAGVLGTAGCSSVPDAVNPVEWYRGASDAVGGLFGGDEPEAGKTAGDPGTSPDTSYPNLGTVPARPTPSTTAEQREALKQGLIADRANARYTEPRASAAAPSAVAPSAVAPSAAASSGRATPAPPQSAPPARSAPASSTAPAPRRSQPQAPQASIVEPQPAPAAVASAAVAPAAASASAVTTGSATTAAAAAPA